MTNSCPNLTLTNIILLMCCLLISACENTDLQTATEAGIDAVKAITLSDQDVFEIARQATQYADEKHPLAPPDNRYSQRLKALTSERMPDETHTFSFAVYLTPEVNAFAMANGTIRVNSGLMDLLDDGELRFVIGHEMGHVVKNHIRQKIQLAYAASAIRKGIASQYNAAGEIARSLFGGLAEGLMNSQFSQLEEKEADDYGLEYLKRQQFDPTAAVSALRKIAKLGRGHAFLSSHPDPDKRADRLQAQLEGKAVSIDENKARLTSQLDGWLEKIPALTRQLLSGLLEGR